MNTMAVLLMGDAYQEMLSDAAGTGPRPRRHTAPGRRTLRSRISSIVAGLQGPRTETPASVAFLPQLKDYPYRG